jgi:hypothetical protein
MRLFWAYRGAQCRPQTGPIKLESVFHPSLVPSSCAPDAQFIYIEKGTVHIFLRIKKSGCMSPTEYYRFDFTLIELKKLL